MSLFERIQKKIIIESSSDTTGQNKGNRNKKKKFSSSISKTVNPQQQELPLIADPVKDVKIPKDIIGGRKPKGRRFGSKNKPKPEPGPYQQQELPFDDGNEKSVKKRPPRKGVDYFFDAEKAKKEREAFQQGRKAYTDSKSGIKAGKVTEKGVVDYITKARNKKQGTNANTKANREAAKVIAKSAGKEYEEKIRKKYETDKDLSRKRGRNQPSYAEIKKGIDARNPVKPGQFTGKPVPAKTPVKPIKTVVTDQELQDVLKTGRKTKPGRTKRITVGSLDARDKAIKDLDDLIIEPKEGDVKQTEKLIKRQRKRVVKRITTPKPDEVSQSEKILDKVKDKIKKKKIKTPPKVETPKVETPKVETPKVETPPKTQTAKQFDGKSFDDFIKDAKKKNKAAQQSIKNIKVDPVTKFGDKLSVGNQIPFVQPGKKRIPNPERVKKIKDYRSMLKSQPKYLRNISKFSRKNPRLRGAAVVLGTLATIAGINKLVTSGTKKPTPVAPPLTKKDIVPLTANLNLSKGNRPTFTPTKPKNT